MSKIRRTLYHHIGLQHCLDIWFSNLRARKLVTTPLSYLSCYLLNKRHQVCIEVMRYGGKVQPYDKVNRQLTLSPNLQMDIVKSKNKTGKITVGFHMATKQGQTIIASGVKVLVKLISFVEIIQKIFKVWILGI